jgi:putative transposase
MAEHMRAGLVIDAVRVALSAAGRIEGSAIFHSDRGSQYMLKGFRDELTRIDIRQKHRKDRVLLRYAAAESFFSVLKSDFGVREWAARKPARSQVLRGIATYCNRGRPHLSIHCLTSVQACVRYGHQPPSLHRPTVSVIQGRPRHFRPTPGRLRPTPGPSKPRPSGARSPVPAGSRVATARTAIC